MDSDDLVTRLLAAIEETEQIAQAAIRWSEGASEWADGENPDWVHIARHSPAAVLHGCAADREIVDMYVGTAKIRDDALAEMNGGASPNHRSLDTWSRATYEASVLLPVIEALAAGYDLTTTEAPDGHHDH